MCSHQLDRNEISEPDSHCPSGWKSQPRISNYCYKLVTTQDTDFSGAQKACEALEDETGHSTNLVSIEG